MKLEENLRMHKRSVEAIAHGALTNSKRPESFVKGVYPTHIQKAHGAFVTDVDGNTYTDYICSLGAILLGHANYEIGSAVIQRLWQGTSFSLGSEIEVETAELLKGIFPSIQRLRFLKTGSEACSAAIRIARAFTRRHTILSSDYHGWHDEFVSLTPPANGIPPHLNIHNLKKDFCSDDFIGVAAVIIEPVVTDWSNERLEWLRRLKSECEKSGTLLIFDETITGMRFQKYSVSNFSGIDPDILILGKALGGGLPLSVVGGRQDVMESDYFVSSTFAGDTLALAACQAIVKYCTANDVITRLWNDGNRFLTEFNKIKPEILRIEGYPTRGVFIGEAMPKALFFQEMVKAGILFGNSWFWQLKHSDESFLVLSICQAVLDRIANGQVKLEGELPKTPFAQKVREQQ